ncbi:hypothetical protein VTL71DRAFT_5613 [Oculimacula yallundae]|uniref:Clr5 domain-containing protein n=1 Tax=Oculimacula yallundae TaxID=86028 RepID=A0ABR4C1I8_9HELO
MDRCDLHRAENDDVLMSFDFERFLHSQDEIFVQQTDGEQVFGSLFNTTGSPPVFDSNQSNYLTANSFGPGSDYTHRSPNVVMQQPPAKIERTGQVPARFSTGSSILTSTMTDPSGSMPRSLPPIPASNGDLEFLYHPNEVLVQRVEGEERPIHPEPPRGMKGYGTMSRISVEEWENRKSDIESLYIQSGLNLESTMAIMASKGFYAGITSYKEKIKAWGWKTYGMESTSSKRSRGKATGKSGTSSLNRSLTVAPGMTTAQQPMDANVEFLELAQSHVQHPSSHLHATQSTFTQSNTRAASDKALPANSSNCTTLAAFTPRRLSPSLTNYSYSHQGIPPTMRDTDFDAILNNVLNNVKNLYISYPDQNKWKVQNHRQVEEDIHDDLLVGVATSLRNSESLSLSIGNKGFENVLQMVGKVVGAEEGADCGLFSLPAILISFLRLVRGNRRWAKRFLKEVLKVAKKKFGHKHPFVKALSSLQKICNKDPDQTLITGVVLAAYGRCIEDVKGNLGTLHLTYLSLWGDFVVYLGGGSVNDTQALVKDIRNVIQVVDAEKGQNTGPLSDYALELLGLILYVLQSSPKMMADQAEEAAEELNRRLEQRMVKDGGKLEGDLLITWKDLRHLLGKICQDKKNYLKAIGYFEEFLNVDIEDERDACALEKLETCYEAVGRYDAAKDVKQRRMEACQKMLKETETDLARVRKVVGDFKGDVDVNGNEDGEGDGAGDNSDSTVGEQAEDYVEEGIADENGDADAEIQILEEEIAGLQQRVKLLRRKKKRRPATARGPKRAMNSGGTIGRSLLAQDAKAS